MTEIPFLQPAAKADPRNHAAGRQETGKSAQGKADSEDFASAYDAGEAPRENERTTPDRAADAKKDGKVDAASKASDTAEEQGDHAAATEGMDDFPVGDVDEGTEDLRASAPDDALEAVPAKTEKTPAATRQNPAELAFRHRLMTGQEPHGAATKAAGTSETAQADIPTAARQHPATAATANAVADADGQAADAATPRTGDIAVEKPVSESDRRTPATAPESKARLVETSEQHSSRTAAPAFREAEMRTTAKAPLDDAGRGTRRLRDGDAIPAAETPKPAEPQIQQPVSMNRTAGGALLRPVDANKAMQGEKALFELHQVDGSEQEMSFHRDVRSAAPASLAQTLARAETPAMIGRQMAEALQRMSDRPVELSLNPKELGRVRLSIAATDAGLTVSVLAERQETLDLMRRHIHELAREFQDIGYGTVNFAFSEGTSGGAAKQEDGAAPDLKSPAAQDEMIESDSKPLQLVASEGLDIRL